MIGKTLISGVGSGLGKYLNEHIPDSSGFGRDGTFDPNFKYETVIHCAFNRHDPFIDPYQYLTDNLLLTQKLLNLNYERFILISSIDVYKKDSYYSLFKTFQETVTEMAPKTQIYRCSMILGDTMRPNHITKLQEDEKYISLGGSSNFNYITMKSICDFIIKYNTTDKIVDFVANNSMPLKDVKKILNSKTNLGDYDYFTPTKKFTNPIHRLYPEFNQSSEENLNIYLNGNT